jgi:hypothetical protein
VGSATVVTPIAWETLQDDALRLPTGAGSGIFINETDAMALNISQYDFTIINSLAELDRKLCVNKALTIGAANVVDNMVECSIADVNAGNCSALTKPAIKSALATDGWTSPDYMGVAYAVKLPAHYFNWSSPYAYGGEGLFGREAYEAALLVVPSMKRALHSALVSDRYKFIASYTAQMLNDQVYTYVVLGADPSQTCYQASS